MKIGWKSLSFIAKLNNKMNAIDWFLAHISDICPFIFDKLSKLSPAVDLMCWCVWMIQSRNILQVSAIRIVCICICVGHSIVTVVHNCFRYFKFRVMRGGTKQAYENKRRYFITKWDADKKPRKFVDIIKTNHTESQTVPGSNVQ